MQREEDVVGFGIGHLSTCKGFQPLHIHHGGVDDFARLKWERTLHFFGGAISSIEYDAHIGGFSDGVALLRSVEVASVHVRYVGLRIG